MGGWVRISLPLWQCQSPGGTVLGAPLETGAALLSSERGASAQTVAAFHFYARCDMSEPDRMTGVTQLRRPVYLVVQKPPMVGACS